MDNKTTDKYLGKLLDGRYEILEVIGTGGMAVIYKALCHRLNRLVAIKVLKDEFALDDDFKRRFAMESQAVAMLSHSNIVAVYDVSRSSEMEYIVMELIDGITLKEYMNHRGTMSWKETLHFSSQIAKALSHAHSRGIIHRDIKPQNIMILKDSSVKVADFGIARLQSTTQNTLTQEALGSVHYMSPEQAKGDQIDARTDIYSLGVVMYEMLTGRLPFEGDSPVSVAIQHISSIPLMPRELNPDIPERLEAITMKAMNPKIEERYASAAALYEDLEEFRQNPENNSKLTGEEMLALSYFDEYSDFDSLPAQKTEIVEEQKRGKNQKEQKAQTYEELHETYRKNQMRSRSVSTLSGIFLVLLLLVFIFVYLWRSWLSDIFSKSETYKLPSFIGSRAADIIENPSYSDILNIIIAYEDSDEYPEGYVISQSPSAGRTVVKSRNRSNLTLTVSSGNTSVPMPDLLNWEYRRAKIELQRLNLKFEQEKVISETVTAGYVISTVPEAGAPLYPGDTVYITVSSGPKIVYVDMPSLIGISLEAASSRLESMNLSLEEPVWVEDSAAKGTVIFQNISEGTAVPEHTEIVLQVSLGPAEVVPESSSKPPAGGEEIVPPDITPPEITLPEQPEEPATGD